MMRNQRNSCREFMGLAGAAITGVPGGYRPEKAAAGEGLRREACDLFIDNISRE